MVVEAATRAARAVDGDEVIAFARALIGAPSENPGGTEDEAAAVATDILARLDANPRTIRSEAGRPNVIGSIGVGRTPPARVERPPRRGARRFPRYVDPRWPVGGSDP